MPRTPDEMRARVVAIVAELEQLEARCVTAGRAEYRRLSDEMNALEQEALLWTRIAARIEAKQHAAYNSGFQAVAAARAAVRS